ncbi:MAG: hypothetical protein MHM6MM_000702 [Cercozoa sp. M6MM]
MATLPARRKSNVEAPRFNSWDRRKSTQQEHLPVQRIGQYQILRKVGQGGSGTQVFEAVDLSPKGSGRKVAIKYVHKSPVLPKEADRVKEALRDMANELQILSQLKPHRNVVSLLGVAEEGDHFGLVYEWCGKGSLHAMLHDSRGTPEPIAALYVRAVAEALVYLHGKNIAHRDIKAQNILISSDNNVKIADFGIACLLQEGDYTRRVVGSPYWMAPEVIDWEQDYDKSCDIWSVGCLAFELLTGAPPYFALDPMAASYQIVADEYPPLPDGISEACEEFLLACFTRDPELRPLPEELLEFDWLRPDMQHTVPTTTIAATATTTTELNLAIGGVSDASHRRHRSLAVLPSATATAHTLPDQNKPIQMSKKEKKAAQKAERQAEKARIKRRKEREKRARRRAQHKQRRRGSTTSRGGMILGVLTLGKKLERFNSKFFRALVRSSTETEGAFASRVFVFRLTRVEYYMSQEDFDESKPPRGFVEYSWITKAEVDLDCDRRRVLFAWQRKKRFASPRLYELQARTVEEAQRAFDFLAGGMGLGGTPLQHLGTAVVRGETSVEPVGAPAGATCDSTATEALRGRISSIFSEAELRMATNSSDSRDHASSASSPRSSMLHLDECEGGESLAQHYAAVVDDLNAARAHGGASSRVDQVDGAKVLDRVARQLLLMPLSSDQAKTLASALCGAWLKHGDAADQVVETALEKCVTSSDLGILAVFVGSLGRQYAQDDDVEEVEARAEALCNALPRLCEGRVDRVTSTAIWERGLCDGVELAFADYPYSVEFALPALRSFVPISEYTLFTE